MDGIWMAGGRKNLRGRGPAGGRSVVSCKLTVHTKNTFTEATLHLGKYYLPRCNTSKSKRCAINNVVIMCSGVVLILGVS